MQDETSGPTPQYVFGSSLDEQETQLAGNPLIRRFAASRQALASDPDRPVYHFVSPESGLNDPNGFSRWRGRWHLFYQGYPAEYEWSPATGKALPAAVPPHWGHAVSDDLVHWRDLPYAIYPDPEELAASGGIWVDEDRAVAFYPGIGTGQMVAVSDDPLLLNWEKRIANGVALGDSDIWKEGDTYVGLVGATETYYPESSARRESSRAESIFGLAVWPGYSVWTSTDLLNWTRQPGTFLEDSPFTDRYDEGSCPVFERIGDRHILLSHSHKNGAQYLLGDYDRSQRTFRPYDHGRFNHGQVHPGGVHAPQAVPDGEGGVIAIHNINEAFANPAWGAIMSLPQRLTLGDDARLRIAPVEALSTLRGEHTAVAGGAIPEDGDWIVAGVEGNTLELDLEIDPQEARWVELAVLRSPSREEHTSITLFRAPPDTITYLAGMIEDTIVLDNSRSSTRPGVWTRPPGSASVDRAGEHLRLRVFIDRSVVEVFVNERLYLATRVHPARIDSRGVSLRAQGGTARLVRFDAWHMRPIWNDVA